MNKTEDLVIKSLAESIGIEPNNIKMNSRLREDLGMDSFGSVEFVFVLEKNLGIKIQQEEMQNIRIVSDIISALNNIQKINNIQKKG